MENANEELNSFPYLRIYSLSIWQAGAFKRVDVDTEEDLSEAQFHKENTAWERLLHVITQVAHLDDTADTRLPAWWTEITEKIETILAKQLCLQLTKRYGLNQFDHMRTMILTEFVSYAFQNQMAV